MPAKSLDRLVLHLKQEEARVKRAESLLRASRSFNPHQRVLLEHALRHPSQLYTVKSHMNSNGITENTARSDLEKLVKAKCLEKPRSHVGKEAAYLAVQGLDCARPGAQARHHELISAP
jgi:Fic family protein